MVKVELILPKSEMDCVCKVLGIFGQRENPGESRD